MRLGGRGRHFSPTASAYVGSAVANRRTPWREARYCVVDLELSGLNPSTDEIISFGAVPIDGGLSPPAAVSTDWPDRRARFLRLLLSSTGSVQSTSSRHRRSTSRSSLCSRRSAGTCS